MEDLLLNLSKEALAYKCGAVHKAAMEAHSLLECQQGTTRDPPYTLRAKCFSAFKLAFESKRSKLMDIGINGIYKMIRDDRFQSNFEPENDSLWFPSQLLFAFNSIQSQADDTQVDMLKVLLYVACSTYCTVNGRIIIQILTVCSEIYENGTAVVKSVSQAASSQILCTFCRFLNEECQEVDSNKGSNSTGILCFNEVIPILQFICSKVDETQRGDRCCQGVIFFLECLHTLMSNLPQKVHSNRHFVTFLWQKLCPALIAFLGSPRVDKKIITREDRQINEGNETGRGSGGLATALGFDSHQAKTIYSIGNQLVRLVGCVGSFRPVLESLYYRMLLYPPPEHRLDALKALNEMWKSANRIVDFAGPILIEDDKQLHCQQSDMALTRLVMDSIEQSCHCGRIDILFASVSCVCSLLTTLKELSLKADINEKYVEKTNNQFASLPDADYSGPFTYDSSTRLPNAYREILEYKSETDGVSSRSRSSSGHSSGDTEGPEEGHSDSETENAVSETERQSREKESERLVKIKKVTVPDNVNLKAASLDYEKENCRNFTKTLATFLPSLLPFRSVLQVDEALQEFSSKYCQGVIENTLNADQTTIMNADGIYLAIYTALKFNMKLIDVGYYRINTKCVPMTEEQFIEEVHGSGVLVYLSANWLSELYQQVLVTNFLQLAGYKPYETNVHSPLINLLTDTDGELCKNKCHLLSDYQRLERTYWKMDTTAETMAGRKISRRILTCCWDSMIDVLSTALQYSAGYGKISRMKLSRKNRNDEQLLRNCFASSLESLQKAAELTNILGLQSRCGNVFSLIVGAACPDVSDANASSLLALLESSQKLHSSQVLGMDVILNCALEFGSYEPECWKHVFRCASYVFYLEQKLFRRTVLKKATKKNATAVDSTSNAVTATAAATVAENLKFTFNSSAVEDDEIMDVYSFLVTSPTPVIQRSEQTVSDLVHETKADASGGYLTNENASRIVCLLSQKVDRLFEEAATKLNLTTLTTFVKELCVASHKQLFSRTSHSEKYVFNKWWKIQNTSGGGGSINTVDGDHSLFLSRVNQLFLKCVKTGRPLLHIMKTWSIIGPHYIEEPTVPLSLYRAEVLKVGELEAKLAACNKEQTIAKVSVLCIHDTITSLLNEQAELPHFHFNEALFKPFEILLCLELCDSDTQDQIVSCICEFVEGNRSDIRSGWRSLFGGLRAVNSVHLASLNNVFKLFLNTDNTVVFSNAAVDFIACLLRHVRGNDDTSGDSGDQTGGEKGLKLSSAALDYLGQCCGILASMYSMPACPIFHTAHSIQIRISKLDSTVLDKEIATFGDEDDRDDGRTTGGENLYECLRTKWTAEEDAGGPMTTLTSLDKPSGVLRVWTFLVESLSFTSVIATGKYQSQALDTLFVILQDLLVVPGVEFALFCVNNIVLPSVQLWLRKLPDHVILDANESATLANFKQCCGNLTDLMVLYFQHLHDTSKMDDGTTTLKLSATLFVELIANSREGITRLGCACLRHVILSSGSLFTDDQWTIICAAVGKACVVSLQPLMQLMAAFHPYSQSFYGDLAQVKVAARRDSTVDENSRIKQLSLQIFLLDSQQDEYKKSDYEVDEERSYVLLLCSNGESTENGGKIIRIPYRDIVMGLLANQLLLQTIATVLIQGTPRIVPSLANVLPQTNLAKRTDKQGEKGTTCSLYGLTTHMSRRHVRILLGCLDFSYEKATSFDSRPGLKFLIQKVAGIERAANLYKQAGACWTLKLVALFELFLFTSRTNDVTLGTIKELMETYDAKYAATEELPDDDDDARTSCVSYLFQLRGTFDKLCQKYISVVLDKDGIYSVIDSVCNQPIFFLISQAEDFPELGRQKCDGVADQQAERKPADEGDDNSNVFKLSDFKTMTIDDDANESKTETSAEVVRKESNGDEEKYEIESVYTMVSGKSVDNVVEEFAKRKKSCTMLPTSASYSRRKNSTAASSPEPLPPEIEQQRKTSIHKDSEAHLAVWAEVLISVFDILAQLDDETFHILLPVFFNGVRTLTAHATHTTLKHALAEFFHRVAVVYGFGQ